jgi:hypothetical protein
MEGELAGLKVGQIDAENAGTFDNQIRPFF